MLVPVPIPTVVGAVFGAAFGDLGWGLRFGVLGSFVLWISLALSRGSSRLDAEVDGLVEVRWGRRVRSRTWAEIERAEWEPGQWGLLAPLASGGVRVWTAAGTRRDSACGEAELLGRILPDLPNVAPGVAAHARAVLRRHLGDRVVDDQGGEPSDGVSPVA